MILTMIGFLMIGIAVTYSLVALAALDERPPIAEEAAQKYRAGLVAAGFLLVVGLLFLRSGPVIIATAGILVFVWSLLRNSPIGSMAGAALMGFAVIVQYSWIFQPSL
jgi:hypothetical protein